MKFINAVVPVTDEDGIGMIVEDDVIEYVERTGLPFPAYMNEDTLAQDYEVETVPFLAFVTTEGRLALTRSFTYKDDVAKILDALIAGRRIDASGMATLDG